MRVEEVKDGYIPVVPTRRTIVDQAVDHAIQEGQPISRIWWVVAERVRIKLEGEHRTSGYHPILYTKGKCLHRHLFPARTFKDLKCYGK